MFSGYAGAQTPAKPVPNRLAAGISLEFVTPRPTPDYTKDVLDPLHKAQAAKAAEDAREAAQRAAQAQEAQLATQQKQTPQIAPTQATALTQWLLTLRTCESSGNYAENTGNGFYGAYQFTIDTWNHWGTGYARADLAPADIQDATIIINTNASQAGLASQNPGCYASQHLSAFPPAN